ncbi:MAG TPA: histidine kinase [Chitinophaga sp.]|uniref:sensor histidine kinase n=1 Tax=Chitinophaga sp. TaxID=1869181 RepID=UPI002C7D2C3D|nr:histidine kinase [Chitinophaga sp.]HVI46875.1 histidine kinase [Chitinophaga sp.]
MGKRTSLTLYWKCQLIGWTIAAFYWEVDAFIRSAHFNFTFAVINFIADIIVNIIITHLYHTYALRKGWHQLSLQALLWRLIPAVVILSVVFTATVMLRFYLFNHYILHSFSGSFPAYVVNAGWVSFIAGIRIMFIWVLAWHMYHYAQREIKAARENAQLQLIAREAQLNNLSAQLNPHFFFNSLNNIKALVIENPDLARRAIDLLSDLLRTSLLHKQGQLIPLRDELGLVKDYLELEQLRFEERLTISLLADEKLMNISVPPLCLQTLVENAIKHGISKKKEGGLITINISEEDNLLKMTVQNPGNLNNIQTSPGLGIRNLKERLQLQFRGSASFHIIQHDGIVLSTLLIPGV